MVKILHFELDEKVGGIESFLYNIYSRIDREKFQFDFVTRYDHPAKERELCALGAHIYKISSLKRISSYIRDISEIIGDYDIVHIHKNSAANIIPFIMAGKNGRVKVISHSHNTAPSVSGFATILHNWNKEKLWKLSDEHLACSNLAGEWLYGNNRKYTVIRNGVPTTNYTYNRLNSNKIRDELNIPVTARVFGNVGRFTKQKNQMYLIRMFNEILKKDPNSYLIMVGEGPLKENIETNVKEMGIIDHVKFLGVRNDVNVIMQAIDVFVMTSLYEGLPIVAVEAQASGATMVLSDTISKETQMTPNIKWFSLKSSMDENVELVMNLNVLGEEERKKAGMYVKKNGFDVENSAEKLQAIYLKLTNKA